MLPTGLRGELSSSVEITVDDSIMHCKSPTNVPARLGVLVDVYTKLAGPTPAAWGYPSSQGRISTLSHDTMLLIEVWNCSALKQ